MVCACMRYKCDILYLIERCFFTQGQELTNRCIQSCPRVVHSCLDLSRVAQVARKKMGDRRTDQRTDGPTDRQTYLHIETRGCILKCAIDDLTLFFCPRQNNIPSWTMIWPWVAVVDVVVDVVQTTFKIGISRECLELLPWSVTWKYLRVSCFENDTFWKIRTCRLAQPTYQPNWKNGITLAIIGWSKWILVCRSLSRDHMHV